MRVKPPGDAGKKRADDKRGDLVAHRVHTHRAGGDFIVVDGDEAATVGGIDQAGHDKNRYGRRRPGPEEIGVAGNALKSTGRADGRDRISRSGWIQHRY